MQSLNKNLKTKTRVGLGPTTREKTQGWPSIGSLRERTPRNIWFEKTNSGMILPLKF